MGKGTHVSIRSKPLRGEWVRILRERDWVTALGPNERGNQLRQASPLACSLPNERRLKIIRATSTHRDQLHLLSSENIAKATAIVMSAKRGPHDLHRFAVPCPPAAALDGAVDLGEYAFHSRSRSMSRSDPICFG